MTALVPEVLVGPRRRSLVGTRSLAVNGGALVLNVLVAGITGLGFWVLVARIASPTVVANGSAAITAVVAVVSLTQQSFVFTLPSLLSVARRPRRLVARVYGLSMALTAVAAPAYLVFGPRLASGLGFLRDGGLALAFVAGSLVWCVFTLQDAVLTGVRRGRLVLAENTGWGAARLALVVALWAGGLRLGVGWLLASWLVPATALAVAVNAWLFGSSRSSLPVAQDVQGFERRRFLSFMGTEYVASVLSSAVTLVGGAYALTTFGASASAPFMTAAALVVVVEGAVTSFAQALAVEASGKTDPGQRRNLLVLTGAFLGGVSLFAVTVAAVGGDTVMAMLGPHYRDSGGTALAILMLCVPARSLAVVSHADNRIRGEGGRNLLQQVVACVVFFGLLATGAITTLPALSWAVVAMRAVPAVVAAQQLRRGRLRPLTA